MYKKATFQFNLLKGCFLYLNLKVNHTSLIIRLIQKYQMY